MAATVANLLKGIQSTSEAPAAKKSGKSKIPELDLGKNQEGLSAIVDHYAAVSAQEEAAANVRKALEAVLGRVSQYQREDDGKKGNYSKSYRMVGSNAEATSTRTNRWTLADKDADVPALMGDLRAELGDAFVDEMFEVQETIEVNSEDQALVKEMFQTLLKAYPGESDKVKKMFLRRRVVSVKGDLDVRQYELSDEQREVLAKAVKQANAGIKCSGTGMEPTPEMLAAEQALVDTFKVSP